MENDEFRLICSADDTLKKVFSLDFASQSAHHKAALAQTIKDYQTRPGDTGSTPVQSMNV